MKRVITVLSAVCLSGCLFGDGPSNNAANNGSSNNGSSNNGSSNNGTTGTNNVTVVTETVELETVPVCDDALFEIDLQTFDSRSLVAFQKRGENGEVSAIGVYDPVANLFAIGQVDLTTGRTPIVEFSTVNIPQSGFVSLQLRGGPSDTIGFRLIGSGDDLLCSLDGAGRVNCDPDSLYSDLFPGQTTMDSDFSFFFPGGAAPLIINLNIIALGVGIKNGEANVGVTRPGNQLSLVVPQSIKDDDILIATLEPGIDQGPDGYPYVMVAGDDGPVRVLSRNNEFQHVEDSSKSFELPASVIRNRNHLSFVSDAFGEVGGQPREVDFNLGQVTLGAVSADGDAIYFSRGLGSEGAQPTTYEWRPPSAVSFVVADGNANLLLARRAPVFLAGLESGKVMVGTWPQLSNSITIREIGVLDTIHRAWMTQIANDVLTAWVTFGAEETGLKVAILFTETAGIGFPANLACSN